MSKQTRVESKTLSSWGGARKKSGRKKLAPSSSVRVKSQLLMEVRKFTRCAGNPRELIEAAVTKELLERQTARDAHFKTVALKQIERYKLRGLPVPAHLLEIAGVSSKHPPA
jgi:hypothetical protein